MGTVGAHIWLTWRHLRHQISQAQFQWRHRSSCQTQSHNLGDPTGNSWNKRQTYDCNNVCGHSNRVGLLNRHDTYHSTGTCINLLAATHLRLRSQCVLKVIGARNDTFPLYLTVAGYRSSTMIRSWLTLRVNHVVFLKTTSSCVHRHHCRTSSRQQQSLCVAQVWTTGGAHTRTTWCLVFLACKVLHTYWRSTFAMMAYEL